VNVLAFNRAQAGRIRDIVVLELVSNELARLAAGAPSDPDVFRHAFSAYDTDAVEWLNRTPLMQALSNLGEDTDAADAEESASR
jgi:Ca2+-binding EF-hand superfamily protein